MSNSNKVQAEIIQEQKYREMIVIKCFHALHTSHNKIKELAESNYIADEILSGVLDHHELIRRVVMETESGRILMRIHNIL